MLLFAFLCIKSSNLGHLHSNPEFPLQCLPCYDVNSQRPAILLRLLNNYTHHNDGIAISINFIVSKRSASPQPRPSVANSL